MEYVDEMNKLNPKYENVISLYLSRPDHSSYFLLIGNNKKTEEEKIAPEEIPHSLKSMITLYQDYKSGAYRKIPYKSILALSSLLYFLLKPKKGLSKVPGVSLVREAGLAKVLYEAVRSDIEKYEIWKSGSET